MDYYCNIINLKARRGHHYIFHDREKWVLYCVLVSTVAIFLYKAENDLLLQLIIIEIMNEDVVLQQLSETTYLNTI